jgi:putative ABC transport system permease protein
VGFLERLKFKQLYLIKRLKSFPTGNKKGDFMIKNYFKIAWRNLMKYKFISFINLFGLMVGLTCCLLITTYILNELSYDRYNKDADNIYRITRTFYNGNGEATLNLSTISPPFGYYLPTDFPEIQKMTRLLNFGTVPLRYKDKLINERMCISLMKICLMFLPLMF